MGSLEKIRERNIEGKGKNGRNVSKHIVREINQKSFGKLKFQI